MPLTIEHHIANPTPGSTAEQQLPPDVAIMLSTPVGSHVAAKGNPLGGDTGARAQGLANFFGSRVVACQDLGPDVPLLRLLGARRRMQHFAEYAEDSADRLAKALKKEDIGRVVMRAHSGAGPIGSALAIHLDRRPELAVTHLAISDPVGLAEIGFRQGWQQWQEYSNGPAKTKPANHGNEPGHPANPPASFFRDTFVRGTTVWLTDVTLRNLQYIAHEQPGTAVRLHLPGNTLTGSREVMARRAQRLDYQLRREDDTVRVVYAPQDHHSSSYDRLSRNADFIRWTLDIAPLA